MTEQERDAIRALMAKRDEALSTAEREYNEKLMEATDLIREAAARYDADLKRIRAEYRASRDQLPSAIQ